MKKFFELDINDDFRRAIVSQFILVFFVALVSISTAIQEGAVFELTYFLEAVFLILCSSFYFKAQKNRNYAFWTISLVFFIYLTLDILKYTFVNYNIYILYICFIGLIFLLINCYVMSSPLFFPRVQWWEYDFRFRGDLKTLVHFDGNLINSRLTDLRRHSACVEGFDFIPLDSEIVLEVDIDNKNYKLAGKLKTIKTVVPGRPHRYGIKFTFKKENSKSMYNELLKVWNLNKSVKLRNKFNKETNES